MVSSITSNIELLAPAGSLSIAIAAINAGADAVYIGADRFSARAAASNPIKDIATLCHYAHPFGVRVYLALNTLLRPDERQEAYDLAMQAIEAGVDAIIVQDMALLEMDLPIPLHASTQTFNNSVERVVELQEAGFERVVLERAVSLSDIKRIRQASAVELELFVHGAICVGYSGVCALSEHLTARSGNRGECAQPCRSRYDLVDSAGRVVLRDEALLSVKDLNLSDHLAQIIEAGVCSLKIEGRLKDESYVVNVVAYYHSLLERLGVGRSSWGRSRADFAPDVRRSFNRGFTTWFFEGTTHNLTRRYDPATPTGEYVGRVVAVANGCATLDECLVALSNGDGLCFVAPDNTLQGLRINRAQGNELFALEVERLAVGTKLYRNRAVDFIPSAIRLIDVDITLDGSSLSACDQYGHRAKIAMPDGMEVARDAQRAKTALKNGLSKGGGTIFAIRTVDIRSVDVPFLPLSAINELRRRLLERLLVECSAWRSGSRAVKVQRGHLENLSTDYLLRSRYCILRQYGLCLKKGAREFELPLFLVNNGKRLAVDFDCEKCEMTLRENL